MGNIAIVTGLIFARFSSRAKILFGKYAVARPLHGKPDPDDARRQHAPEPGLAGLRAPAPAAHAYHAGRLPAAKDRGPETGARTATRCSGSAGA